MPYGSSLYGSGVYEAPTYDQAVDALPPPFYHWKLGETVGSGTVADRKGNYPVALTVDTGATLGVPGIALNNGGNTAVAVDGTTAGSMFGTSGTRPTVTATVFAWSVWFKVDATNTLTGFQYICSLTGTGIDHSGIGLNGNKIEGFFQSGASYITADSVTSVVAGGSYRASCSYDGANLVVRISGVTETTTPSTAVPNTGSGFSVVIGMDWAQALRFKGVVDEVAFYTQPLPAAKDLAEYTAGSTTGLTGTATDAISLSDVATRGAVTRPRSATESLSLSDVAARGAVTRPRSASEAIVVSDAAARGAVARPRTASDALSLSDVATRAAQTFNRAAADAISLSDTARVSAISTHLTASDALSLADVVTASVNGNLQRVASDALSLSDAATARVTLSRAALDGLTLTDSATNGAPGPGTAVGSKARLMFYGR